MPPPGYPAAPYGDPAYGNPAYGNPGYGYGPALGPKPDSYLVPAILTTLFCCLPSGIVAIVFASQVDSKYARGDYAGSVASARNAKAWTWVSVGLGLATIALWILLFTLGESSGDTYYYD